MANLNDILNTHKDKFVRTNFSSNNNRLQSELNNKKVGLSDNSTMADLERAIHNYLEYYIDEKLDSLKQEAINQFKNVKLPDGELNRRVLEEWYDKAYRLESKDFSVPKTDLVVDVVDEENQKVLHTTTVVIDNQSIDYLKAHKSGDSKVEISFWITRDVLEEFRQIFIPISNHNHSVKVASICDAESPREKHFVIDKCESSPSDNIPDGAVLNRRLLEQIEGLHRRMLACSGYAKLYVGIKYVDSDDILQLERFSLGSTGEFEELYNMLNHFSRKFKNTQPFDR